MVIGDARMPGQLVARTWQYDPTADAPARYRRACRYDAFIPERLRGMKLSLDAEIVGVVSEAEHAIQSLNAAAHPALAPLARLLLRTESIASSKVEGMQMATRELARAEAKADVGGRIGADALEILGNIDAMEVAVDQAAAAPTFTVAEIVAIHRQLMRHAPNKHLAGQLRTRQNWIGGNDYNPCGADFVPPPPEEMDALLVDLCDAVNHSALPPLVQAALVHAQFETIHPFDDGNGRTGRALTQVVLRRRGLAPVYVPPISVVLAAARDRYVAGLTAFRFGDVGEWIEQFAGAAARAARLATAYLDAVQALTMHWRNQLAASPGAPRADAAAWRVIEALPAHPIITGQVAVAATGRSRPQVYQALDRLAAAGVLVSLSSSKRNQSWEAVGLLDLLAGLETGQVPVPAPRARRM
jgi:Fic family protein